MRTTKISQATIGVFAGVMIVGIAFGVYRSKLGTFSGHLEAIGEQTDLVTNPMPDSYRGAFQMAESWLENRGFERIDKPPYEVEPLLIGLGTTIEENWWRGTFEESPEFYVITNLVTDKNGDVMMHHFHVGVSWQFVGLRSMTFKKEEKVKKFIDEVRDWWAAEKQIKSRGTATR